MYKRGCVWQKASQSTAVRSCGDAWNLPRSVGRSVSFRYLFFLLLLLLLFPLFPPRLAGKRSVISRPSSVLRTSHAFCTGYVARAVFSSLGSLRPTARVKLGQRGRRGEPHIRESVMLCGSGTSPSTRNDNAANADGQELKSEPPEGCGEQSAQIKHTAHKQGLSFLSEAPPQRESKLARESRPGYEVRTLRSDARRLS